MHPAEASNNPVAMPVNRREFSIGALNRPRNSRSGGADQEKIFGENEIPMIKQQ
jgi:hypothetical protein